jgi:serine/threonine protein phosphatase PrpC
MSTKCISEPAVYFDADMPEAEMHHVSDGTVSVLSVRCPAKQTPNEDAAAVIPFDDHSGVLVVADGMGGGRAGEQAAELAVRSIGSSLEAAAEEGQSLRMAILNGIDAANRDIQSLGIGAATTLAVVEVHDQTIRTYHVGDSLILVTGQRGKRKLQTVSHSPVGFAVEAGVLDQDEAMHHADRHVVSNMVGMPDMRIEIGSALKLAARDTLILASDGLADNLHVDEIVDRIRKGPLQSTVMQLAADVRRRMINPAQRQPSKPDDFTVVAFRPVQMLQDRRKAGRLLSAG